MVEAKLLRKKLKNGLIVDKWDLVSIIEKQQAEIEALKAEVVMYRTDAEKLTMRYVDAVVSPQLKTLTDEEIIALWNEMVDRKLLKKASENV